MYKVSVTIRDEDGDKLFTTMHEELSQREVDKLLVILDKATNARYEREFAASSQKGKGG